MSRLMQEDIEHIVSDTTIPWNELQDSSFLVTGATGLIGSVLTHALSSANKKYRLNARIIAHGRSAAKGEALLQHCGVEFLTGDIRTPSLAEYITYDRIDYILHCAAITKSTDMVAKPVDVVTTNVNGTWNVLELARERRCRSLVYLSSMEIYGQTELRVVSESDLGYLDLSTPRSSYPESKRLCEALCVAYAVQYGLPGKIARLAQTFGAGTPKDDTRVFAQFARSAIADRNIEIHTQGASRGNYCYISDTVRGLLTILLKGKNGEAYNVANPTASATIRQVAELVADKICSGRIKVVVHTPRDIEKRGYAPHTEFSLAVEKLEALGWTPKYSLDEMFRRLLADWQGRKLCVR